MTKCILGLILLVVIPGNGEQLNLENEEPNHMGSCVCQCPDLHCPDLHSPDLQCPDVQCSDLHCPDIQCPDVQCDCGHQTQDPPAASPTADCQELLENGHLDDGLYYVVLGAEKVQHQVYCQMQAGNGWLVIQRRQDGRVNFTHTFDEYTSGFGYLTGEFWLGNDALHRLTNQKNYTLRVEMRDCTDAVMWAEYSRFRVASALDKFRLTVTGFSGSTARDSLVYHNNQQFSAVGQDNDMDSGRHCAEVYKSGWWFNACHRTNLNGVYTTTQHETGYHYLSWQDLSNTYRNLKVVTMKVRPTP